MSAQLMTLTNAAAEQIKSLISQAPEGQEILGLRVGVQAAGCSGLGYVMDYATEENPLDITIEDKGVKIFVDASSQLYLAGIEIDWMQDKFESGFVFNNPNAKGHCGCGKSFSVEGEGE
ncbi:MAG: iron-sulfur cluster assembly accessory protein [Alphaproteobacteria bacterium]|nr:iron-sulfur cluster assembly accessory protein [Alphaproteobacteria bacterium]